MRMSSMKSVGGDGQSPPAACELPGTVAGDVIPSEEAGGDGGMLPQPPQPPPLLPWLYCGAKAGPFCGAKAGPCCCAAAANNTGCCEW